MGKSKQKVCPGNTWEFKGEVTKEPAYCHPAGCAKGRPCSSKDCQYKNRKSNENITTDNIEPNHCHPHCTKCNSCFDKVCQSNGGFVHKDFLRGLVLGIILAQVNNIFCLIWSYFN